ncbi:MAG: homocysteine S-methyltransferase family protein [Candidatus Marinimicrobia bacterium]|nr:homocysteine S-methyltransferase family protein [Candidatus Neomarinimicrobiota bacterium]MCH8023514.1 homocysteine S-methyltransferase family protein [Candidatus Neomarinimicrobiota bacterium]
MTSGLSVIGCCCGAGPEHIRSIRQVPDQAPP